MTRQQISTATNNKSTQNEWIYPVHWTHDKATHKRFGNVKCFNKQLMILLDESPRSFLCVCTVLTTRSENVHGQINWIRMTKVGNEMNARAILSSYTNVGTTNHQMSVHLNKYNSFHWFYFHFIISAIVVMHFFFSLKNLLLLSHRLDSGSVYLFAFSILSAIFLLRAVTTCTICVCVFFGG